MTQTIDIEGFRVGLSGAAVTPGDAGYDQARCAWNAEIDRYPAVIARCAGAADVAKSIKFARQHGLEISVRGGFHNVAGRAICDDGMMIDLSLMRDVSVDPATRRARTGGGATVADLDAATQVYGLATPAGMVSHTGVGGLTLGGGMGWLTPQHGLMLDNLVSAEVVLADGRRLRANSDENPDLFWALRGGGGNFGVVTEFEYRLHPVGPMVHLGMSFWGLEQAAAALRLGREIVATLSANATVSIVGMNAPSAPSVPEQFHCMPGYALFVAGFGTGDDHARIMTRIREQAPSSLFEVVTPMPYPQLQQIIDEDSRWGLHCYDRTLFLDELSDEVIAVIAEHQPRKTSPLSVFFIDALGPGYGKIGDEETAFGGSRAARFNVFFVAKGENSEQLSADRAWVRTFSDAMRPHAIGGESYLNAMAVDEDRVRASYGPAKYERLARIKAKYDPDNVFHHNANIKPAVQPI